MRTNQYLFNWTLHLYIYKYTKCRTIAAIRHSHEKYQQKTVARKALTTFFALILTINKFIFHSKFHWKNKVCAMGTISTLILCKHLYDLCWPKIHLPIAIMQNIPLPSFHRRCHFNMDENKTGAGWFFQQFKH